MRIQYRAVLFFGSVLLLVGTTVLFLVTTSRAGSKWLEQCHGLPTFSSWNVEPSASGGANMVYHFATHCAKETKLFGYEEHTFFIKGTWNRDTKGASELITNINHYVTPNGHKETKTITVRIVYYCNTHAFDPWKNHDPNQCNLHSCISTPNGYCSIKSKYVRYPITYNLVPKNLDKTLTEALLGPLEITAPSKNELITPGFSGNGKVIVKLHGPAPSPPKNVLLSLEMNHGNNDWESPFPAPGEAYHIPSAANRVSGINGKGIAATYEVPMTYDTFKLTPTKTLNGKWRIRACAQGLKNKICSHWTEFKVVNMLYDKVRGTKLHRIPAQMFKLKHVTK